MKKTIAFFLFFLGTLAAQAQSDSLEHYTGKYIFPDGSPVTEIGVIIDNGVLTATSAMGNSELRATGTKDVYEIVAYSGMATFRRNDDGKVKQMRVQVQDLDMVGVKQEAGFSAVFLHKIPLYVFRTH